MLALLAAALVSASAPTDVSVTVYRAPRRSSSSLELDGLEGFALVTETRTVSLPAGESRVRFPGVADGIQPQSALIAGLPSAVREKNHDAKVLSPAALVAATVGHDVWLVRTNPKTGKRSQVRGTLVADTDGVVFQGPQGLEALRCSGLPETFEFESIDEANATPTLSAVVDSPAPMTAQVRLSYLARGFDWMANYIATVSPDGKTVDLGAWVTLANGNGVSFPDAHAQVVAGRLNRESGEVEPVDEGAEIVAQCWPMGTTSDTPEPPNLGMPFGLEQDIVVTGARRELAFAAPAPMMAGAMTKAVLVQQEELGDLKLYRVPERTSVTSRQIKQVRLLDRQAIPGEIIYGADLPTGINSAAVSLQKVFRTRNDNVHHLGVPLPSGRVDAFYERAGTPLLVSEAPLRDVAEDEEFEIPLGEASDVEVTAAVEQISVDLTTLKRLPLIPGVVDLRSNDVSAVNRLDVSNAHDMSVSVELRLVLPDGWQLLRADHTPTTRNGRPTFRLSVPARGAVTIQYQTAHTVVRSVPTPSEHP
jgi:hypothetical protein